MERVRNRPKYEIRHTVIPKSELFMIQDLILSDGTERQRETKEDRERLKKQSEERVKNWPNTIEASRMKKEQERKERLAKEEDIRAGQDSKEAEYQAEQRRQAIERANLLLYEQDDRIRTFNSKMQLAHVLEERKKQLDVTQMKADMERRQAEEWDHTLREQLRIAKIEEDRQKREAKDKARRVQEMQTQQLEETKKRWMKNRQEAKLEGEGIRAAAERSIIQELEEEKQKREKLKKLAKEYEGANAELERTKEEALRREEEENLKIQKFAQLKEQQMMERKRRADEKFKHDMEKRQNMIDAQAERLKSLKDAHEQRIQKQMDELEVQKEHREIQDREKRFKIVQDMDNNRRRQLDMRERKKQRDMSEQEQFRKQWANTAEQLLIEEMNERGRARESAKRLKDFQMMQVGDKSYRKKVDKEQERMEGELMKQAMEEETEMFDRYINSVMDEYSTKGLDTTTLKSVRRRHMPLTA